MAGYRVFKLRTSASDEQGGHACWADYGMVDLEVGDDGVHPNALGEQFGDGEYLILDENATIVDYATPET
jgi:hypothetical protein